MYAPLYVFIAQENAVAPAAESVMSELLLLVYTKKRGRGGGHGFVLENKDV
jgi:hypothetical protein